MVDKTVEEMFVVQSDRIEASVPPCAAGAIPVAEEVNSLDHLASSEYDKLKRATSIYKKCNTLNSELFVKTTELGERFNEEIFGFAEDIKERFDQLAKDTASIPEGGDREKRISAVKGLLTKKRRALFDLFTGLKSTGLSFKRGLILSRDTGLINKWFQFQAENDDVIATKESRNKIINRFTFIAQYVRQPDKAVSKNEYDRVLGYTFQIANHITVQRTQIDNLSSQTEYFKKCLDQSNPTFIQINSHIEILSDLLDTLKCRLFELNEFLKCAPEEVFTHRLNLSNVPPIALLSASQVVEIRKEVSALSEQIERDLAIISTTHSSIVTLPTAETAILSITRLAERSKSLVDRYSGTFESDNLFFDNVAVNVAKLNRLSLLVKSEVKTQREQPHQVDEEFLNKFLERIMFNYQEALDRVKDLTDESKLYSEGMG